MKKVSILIPAYNEQESLPLLYDKLTEVVGGLPQYEWEFMFVNDGSRDRTLEMLQELRAKDTRVNYVDLSRNFGKEVAMLAGFDYVSGDCAVIMDADLQDPPSLLPLMLSKWEEGYEDVYAQRKSRGEESWLRRKLSLMFYSILQIKNDKKQTRTFCPKKRTFWGKLRTFLPKLRTHGKRKSVIINVWQRK